MKIENLIPNYEVYAVRYAAHDRTRRDNFIASSDPHDEAMPMDYYVWVIKGNGNVWLVDTGFNAEMASRRRRNFLRCPIESLKGLGIVPEDIGHVIVTHLHYDHAGNLNLLPDARIHIQQREVYFATGCQMCKPLFRAAFAVEDVIQVIKGVYADRVSFCHGDTQLAPGIETALIGGHTDGLQIVRVHTQRGWVVLASDASHYYENMDAEMPYPIVFHVGDMVAGWDKVRSLADSAQHVVPGHDPDVLLRYPAPSGLPKELLGEVVCLHETPSR